jgi:predicted enzyme related to lactoylglutathione lyase
MAPNDDTAGGSEHDGVDSGLSRPGGISYLHIPATDVRRAATFYEKVFGWSIRGGDTDRPSFDDGTGHVSGAWMSALEIAAEPGLLPYIYVTHIDESVEAITAEGGEVLSGPRPEGNLWVATFRDSEGNAIGLWQEGPR